MNDKHYVCRCMIHFVEMTVDAVHILWSRSCEEGGFGETLFYLTC